MNLLNIVITALAFCSIEVHNVETGKVYDNCPVRERETEQQKRYRVTDDGKIIVEDRNGNS